MFTIIMELHAARRTSGVLQDVLDQDGVLGDPLGHQQNALLDAMATQQRVPTQPLHADETHHQSFTRKVLKNAAFKTPTAPTSPVELKE